MNFRESETYLLSLGNEVSAMKLGLENIRKLLAALGNPEKNYLKVQVAGTNGKGSVCAFLDAICLSAGIKTGLYTSPHLISITERIKINGREIGEEDFARYATHVREKAEELISRGELENMPTFFEQLTAIALLAFAEAKVELAILETGLGGRLDATTAANAEISAITKIDLDHQEYLGNTIEEIAAEKAAIIHAGSKVVIGEQSPEALRIILNRCSMFGITARTKCEARVCAIETINHSTAVLFRTENDTYSDSSLGIRGRHQIENARISILLAETLRFDFGFKITSDNVIDGLEKARHAGRLEYQGRYLFDGAHNVGGAKALAAYLKEFETVATTIIFGAMSGKDVAEMAKILFPTATRIVLTEPNNSRSMPCNQILEILPLELSRKNIFVSNSVENAIEIAKTITPDDKIILVTGSLYLIGDVKKVLAPSL